MRVVGFEMAMMGCRRRSVHGGGFGLERGKVELKWNRKRSPRFLFRCECQVCGGDALTYQIKIGTAFLVCWVLFYQRFVIAIPGFVSLHSAARRVQTLLLFFWITFCLILDKTGARKSAVSMWVCVCLCLCLCSFSFLEVRLDWIKWDLETGVCMNENRQINRCFVWIFPKYHLYKIQGCKLQLACHVEGY